MAKRSRDNYVSDDYEDAMIHMPLDESYDPDEVEDYDNDDDRFWEGSAEDADTKEIYKEDSDESDAVDESDLRRRKTERKQPRRVKNKKIMGILYGFLAVFLVMIGYFIYFDVIDSEEALSNPNNIRVAKMADTVVRGRIMSADGAVLAETLKDGEGNEYRNYPYNEMFAHVVGMSKTNRSGIEASGEYYLLTSSINPLRRIYNEIRGEKSTGDDVWTTLDAGLQATASAAIGTRQGAVVAMEPGTGRVLCMVSKPDYNPNTLAQSYESIIADENSKVLLNQATSGRFAPGSIFKLVTALEYIREYPNYDNYSYQCSGSITLASDNGNASLSCYGGRAHGLQDLDASFVNSCNASFANIGLNLDIAKFGRLCDSMLFNRDLPTDIAHVRSSFELDADASQWEVGAASIGQGKTQMTPLHALILTSAVANGGVVMKPYLIDSVRNIGGAVIERFTPESGGSLMTPEEAQILKDMMKNVVSRGTASSLSGMGVEIAGKTGTAEVENAGNNAWFIGFAPADAPQIAVCVLVTDTNSSSSESAVPIAGQVFSTYFAGRASGNK